MLLTPMQYRYGSIVQLETFKPFSADLVNECENLVTSSQTKYCFCALGMIFIFDFYLHL